MDQPLAQPALERIRNIEAGRAVAAILVVLYHIDKYYFASDRYWSEAFLGGLFSFGHAGVEFFFVLSGLLMTMIHFDDLGVPGRVGAFARKRFARIYPFYWFCTALMFAALLAIPSFAGIGLPGPMRLLHSVTLVGGDPHDSLIFIAWTLYHEILFYAVFAIALWRPRIGIPLALGWFAACAIMGARDLDIVYPLKFVNILFLFGVAAGLALRRPTLPVPAMLAAVGVALFLATGIDDAYYHLLPRAVQIACFGAGAALTLAGTVTLERQRRLSAPAALVVAGQASYSIYLTHMMTLPVAAKLALLAGVPRWLPGPIAFVGLALLAIAVGIIIHFRIEKPLVRRTRRLLA
jgi:peptidoglycan/LPS O-acetylase OafA/YrhL